MTPQAVYLLQLGLNILSDPEEALSALMGF
jgi:hypothetical protein